MAKIKDAESELVIVYATLRMKVKTFGKRMINATEKGTEQEIAYSLARWTGIPVDKNAWRQKQDKFLHMEDDIA